MGRRVLFMVATSRRGLGHLRRLTEITRALRSQARDLPVELVTNAALAGMGARDRDLYDAVHECPREKVAPWLESKNASGVVVDTARIPGLEAVQAPLALILREAKPCSLGRFALPGRAWQKIIIPNPREHWRPDPNLIEACETVHVGWIFRKPRPSSRRPSQDIRRLLIASGGGGIAHWQVYRTHLARWLAAIRKRVEFPVSVEQAIGPRAGREARVPGVDRYFEPGSELHEQFADYDLVISSSGYNSVLELAASDVPALLLALPTTYDDQGLRARQWGPLLGDSFADQQACCPVAWLSETLQARKRRVPAIPVPSGAEAAAAHLLDLVAERE